MSTPAGKHRSTLGKWGSGSTCRPTKRWSCIAFVMTLRLSRHQFAYWCVKQDQATWCQAHIAAFAFFGEVPRRIIFDNLKDGVVKSDLYDPVLNRTYRDLANHCGFLVDPGRVARPKDNGRGNWCVCASCKTASRAFNARWSKGFGDRRSPPSTSGWPPRSPRPAPRSATGFGPRSGNRTRSVDRR